MRMTRRGWSALLAAFWLLAVWAPVLAQSPNDRALAIYEEGKKLYDAGDFAGARSKFNEAIKAEPGNARWHYNLGLVHRQMGNYNAARDSLMRARELDPGYKRDEISQKLTSMGFDSAGGVERSKPAVASSDSDGNDYGEWAFIVVLLLIAGFVWRLVRGVRDMRSRPGRGSKSGVGAKGPPPSPAEVAAIGHRLDDAARQLVLVEHALRFSEHADLRSQLDHATQLERDLREMVADARLGDGAQFRSAGREIGKLEDAARGATELAKQVFGAAALAAGGQRIACYFCARPLANPDYRRLVTVMRGDSRASVVSCPGCAGRTAQGESPEILVAQDGRTHWSEIPGFDPYVARHSAVGGVQRIPAWRYAPQRSVSELALLAAGSAVAGGALASMLGPANDAGAEPLLDLDVAQKNGLAQEALRAAAKQASARRGDSSSSDRSSSDHSSSDHS